MFLKLKGYFSKNNKSVLVIVFLISVSIRTILGIATGEYITFRDELLHLNLAKALAIGEGISFRGYFIRRYDILYSLFISLATLIDNAELEHILIMIINSIMMSSVVFPTYLLGKKLELDSRCVYIASIFSLTIPEMIYTSSVLQENLMYPLAIWYLVIFVYLYDCIEKKKNILVLSICTFILCLVKDFGLAFFVGTVLFFIFEFITKNKDRKSFIKIIITYICSFIFVWLTYRKIIEFITYEDTLVIQPTDFFKRVFSTILNLNILLRMIYPFIVYCIVTITFFGVFPILLPISQYKELNLKVRKLLELSIFTIISYIGVTCIAITSVENYDSLNLRIHYRYYFFIIIPIIIVFLSMIKRIKMNSNLFFLSIVYVLLLAITNIFPVFGSAIDCPVANILRLFNSDMLKKTVPVLIILMVCFCTYLIYTHKHKLLFTVIVAMTFFCFFIDTFVGYRILYGEKSAHMGEKNIIQEINRYIGNSTKNADDILIIGEEERRTYYLEAYFQQPYKVTTKDEFLSYINDGVLNNIHMNGFSRRYICRTRINPMYIITQDYIDIEGYSLAPLELFNYQLYVLGGEEIVYNDKPNVYGRYFDKWINKECMIIFSGDKGEEKTKIELEMDTIFENEMQINVVDGTGYTQTMIVTPSKSKYEIYVNKMSDELKYEVSLSTNKNYNPNNGDPRMLSFRVFSVDRVKE